MTTRQCAIVTGASRGIGKAVAAALGSIGLTPFQNSKVVRIKNTLELEILETSTACADAVSRHPHVEILKGPYPMPFGEDGNLRAL